MKAVRGDCRAHTMIADIAEQYGLPIEAVRLMWPNGYMVEARASLAAIRSAWENAINNDRVKWEEWRYAENAYWWNQ